MKISAQTQRDNTSLANVEFKIVALIEVKGCRRANAFVGEEQPPNGQEEYCD